MKNLVQGYGEMIAKLKQVQAKFPDKVKRAIYLEAQIEMTEAKRRVPVDTGILRASGQVHEPERDGKKVSVTLSFGGGTADDYAVPVHENLDAHHANGQAKYLESVLMESAPHMAERIAARISLDKDDWEAD